MTKTHTSKTKHCSVKRSSVQVLDRRFENTHSRTFQLSLDTQLKPTCCLEDLLSDLSFKRAATTKRHWGGKLSRRKRSQCLMTLSGLASTSTPTPPSKYQCSHSRRLPAPKKEIIPLVVDLDQPKLILQEKVELPVCRPKTERMSSLILLQLASSPQVRRNSWTTNIAACNTTVPTSLHQYYLDYDMHQEEIPSF
uniref:Uncharacterized protein n=1 Tax=Chaetoceros debilis TaxID=122233 RepID=A0A7S3PZ86_9STRA|mmetsp:Transcript_16568/g.24850  ORF Transcript_16568/g.24850 Transcript_16568/m.24850 type:complete len:195 (+) Transcript_16568:268-852(+)